MISVVLNKPNVAVDNVTRYIISGGMLKPSMFARHQINMALRISPVNWDILQFLVYDWSNNELPTLIT